MPLITAFIGLGQIGLSAALALAEQSKEIRLTGWDPDIDARVAADRTKIFTPVCKRAKDAVHDANLIFLSLHADDVLPTLKELAVSLHRELAVVALTPLHFQTRQWVREAMGKHMPFISLYPIFDQADLESREFGENAARADIFEKQPIYIADTPDASPAMLDLAVDTAVLLGGQPVFISPEELDGLISANILLQQVAAAVLMKTTAEQPSWYEGNSVAGKSLFQATLPLMDLTDREILGTTATANGKNLSLLMDGLIKNLIQMRDDLKAQDLERVGIIFEDALEFRSNWLSALGKARLPEKLASSVPGKDEALKHLMKLRR